MGGVGPRDSAGLACGWYAAATAAPNATGVHGAESDPEASRACSWFLLPGVPSRRNSAALVLVSAVTGSWVGCCGMDGNANSAALVLVLAVTGLWVGCCGMSGNANSAALVLVLEVPGVRVGCCGIGCAANSAPLVLVLEVPGSLPGSWNDCCGIRCATLGEGAAPQCGMRAGVAPRSTAGLALLKGLLLGA